MNNAMEKTLVATVAVGVAAGLLALMASRGVFTAFSSGFAVGLVNQYLGLKAARRAIALKPEEIVRYITTRYYLRFFIVSAATAALVWNLGLNLALVCGLVLPLFVTIASTALMLKRSFGHA